MNLTAINLNGFKSFCDNVTITVRDGLVGVVGPNGCGKSNVLDALRWGLGESRASSLRGGALQDVLFNGSDKRAPSDYCSVEMHFTVSDNEELGMWRGCANIVARRELERDGQSYFYINKQLVRRRDVVELFRGTGISPRSYAIVEQGMVGSIAEASPDELRQFLEETAGISHYKDRRRETERRLASARTNLEQLLQLLEDARRRQESLKRQARAARRYRELSEQINDVEALLILDKRQHTEQQMKTKSDEIKTLESTISAKRAQISDLRGETVQAREKQQTLQQQQQQQENELVRTQAAMENMRRDYQQIDQKRALLQQRTATDKQEKENVALAIDQCAAEHKQSQEELTTIDKKLQQHSGDDKQRTVAVESSQVARDSVIQQLETARHVLNDARQRHKTCKVQLQMNEEKSRSLNSRLEELSAVLKQTARDGDTPPPADNAVTQVSIQEEKLTAAAAAVKGVVTQAQTAEELLRATEKIQIAAEAERDSLQRLKEKHQWKIDDIPPPLVEMLNVEAGEWSKALDAALGRLATGYVVDSLDDFLQKHGLPPDGLGIVNIGGAQPSIKNASTDNHKTLLSVLKISSAAQPFLADWLDGVYVAQDESSARQLRHELAVGQMVITREGNIYMRDAILAAAEVGGGFDWQQRLDALNHTLKNNEKQLSTLRQKHERLCQKRDQSQKFCENETTTLTAARAALSEYQVALGQWEERQRAAQARRDEVLAQMQEMKTARHQSIEVCQQLATEDKTLDAECQQAAKSLAAIEQAAEQATDALAQRREEFHSAGIHQRELIWRQDNLKQKDEALVLREKELDERRQSLLARIKQTESEMRQLDESKLAQSISEYSNTITAAQKMVKQTEQTLSAQITKATKLDDERESQMQELERLQQRNTELQIEKRELLLSLEGLSNSLEDLEYHQERLDVLRQDNKTSEEWRTHVDRLRGKRERLGAINFTADQELTECAQRLEEMESQYRDVESAIEELQKTIRHIDGETRARLRDVYEVINREFCGMFRRLFGGGDAELSMKGDSFLDAEFEIRAKLPGKRMFPVRMLSGGEKSATALAFIFTLMRYTPPPFCIMDEVDATLDDARTDAFIGLLKDMSREFQCLVITHNKSTIESVEHLIGVTQEEKGVSKIVLVTRADALRAASA